MKFLLILLTSEVSCSCVIVASYINCTDFKDMGR